MLSESPSLTPPHSAAHSLTTGPWGPSSSRAQRGTESVDTQKGMLPGFLRQLPGDPGLEPCIVLLRLQRTRQAHRQSGCVAPCRWGRPIEQGAPWLLSHIGTPVPLPRGTSIVLSGETSVNSSSTFSISLSLSSFFQ